MKNLTTKEIAQIIEGQLDGPADLLISGLNRIEFAKEGELSFISEEKYISFLENTKAAALIVSNDLDAKPKENQCFIRVDKPYPKFAALLEFIYESMKKRNTGIHPKAVIHSSAEIAEDAFIGANCVIGENCKIASGVRMHANITVYDNVSIGTNTEIFANAVIHRDTTIGNDCIIYAGAVIGGEGFGYIENSDGSFKRIPQMGNVIIKDKVEIGSNTTVDRALIGSTIIEEGVKIDNLVQIAHNCIIGENTAIVSQVGISGSAKLGKRNRVGGQVGLAGHLETADDVILAARSGVAKSIKEKGYYFGAPAKPYRQAMRIEAVMGDLPDTVKYVAKLKREEKK